MGGILGDAMSFGSMARAQHNTKLNYKHRYRWAMDDLRKAGLNPILAGQMGGGMGSSTALPMQGVDSNINTAMKGKRQSTELRGIDEQTKTTKLRGAQHAADTIASTESAARDRASTAFTQLQHEALAMQMPGNLLDAHATQQWGVRGRLLEKFIGTLGPAGSALIGGALGGRLGRGGNKRFQSKAPGTPGQKSTMKRGEGRLYYSDDAAPYVGPRSRGGNRANNPKRKGF